MKDIDKRYRFLVFESYQNMQRVQIRVYHNLVKKYV